MKKILAIILAALMIAACSVTAFAETTNVSYNVDPSYTVSIPAAVTLGDSAVEADITASDVILEGGKQVVVELTSASNTASGSTFNAKNGDSTVTYTITGDEAIAVGDTVATFTANGSKTLTFSAADKSAATVAGAHTETLTFGVKLEDPNAPKIYNKNSENIADGVVLENVGDTIDTTDTLKGLIFNSSAKMDFKNDGTMVFNFEPNDQINGVESMYLDDNRDFICVTSAGKGKLIPDEGKQFRVKYNLEDNRWIIDQV